MAEQIQSYNDSPIFRSPISATFIETILEY